MPSVVVTFLASFLIWFLFLGMMILWIIDGKFKKEYVLHALFAVAILFFLTFFIKELFYINRPYIVDHVRPLTFTVPQDGSFPSFHTAMAFAIATTIFLHDRKVGLWFFLGAMLVALGRVMADVHYPSDAMFGAIIGFLVAWLVARSHMFGLIQTTRRK